MSWKQDLTKMITLLYDAYTQDIYPYNYISFSARQSLFPQSPRHLPGQGLSKLHKRFLMNKAEKNNLRSERRRMKWKACWISVCVTRPLNGICELKTPPTLPRVAARCTNVDVSVCHACWDPHIAHALKLQVKVGVADLITVGLPVI